MSNQTGLSNKIPLNAGLADTFKSSLQREKKAVLEIAELAAQVRDQHLGLSGHKYDGEFTSWWKSNRMEGVFGTLSTFTTYANAGDAVGRFRAQFEKHIDQMPTSKAALIELGELNDDEIKLCLQNTYSRASLTAPESAWKRPKKPKPLIHSGATAKELKAWREAWRTPKSKSANDKRRLPLITIKVHGSFYDFDNSGNYKGTLSKEDIRSWSEKIQEMLAKHESQVLVESDAERLCSGHDSRRERAAANAKKRAGVAIKKSAKKVAKTKKS